MAMFGRKNAGGGRVHFGRKHKGTRSFGRKVIHYGKRAAMTGVRIGLPIAGEMMGEYVGGPVGGAVGAAVGERIAKYVK